MKTSASYVLDESVLLRWLRRIEGQAPGIARIIEEDRYCAEISQQMASMQTAADSVAMMPLEDHLKGCLGDGSHSRKPERVDEVLGVIRRYMKR